MVLYILFFLKIDLTMALSNPIKFFNAHDKKMKNADANNGVSYPNNILFV